MFTSTRSTLMGTLMLRGRGMGKEGASWSLLDIGPLRVSHF